MTSGLQQGSPPKPLQTAAATEDHAVEDLRLQGTAYSNRHSWFAFVCLAPQAGFSRLLLSAEAGEVRTFGLQGMGLASLALGIPFYQPPPHISKGLVQQQPPQL